MKVMSIVSRGIFLVFFCLLIAACADPKIAIKKNTIYEPPMVEKEKEYRLGPGDVIEIVYHYAPKPDKSEYYLAVGDIIKVEFAYHKDMNRQLTLRPDGNIAMPRKGDVTVIGLTPEQVRKKITMLYSVDFKNPLVTITMIQYNRAIDHLKKAITTSPRGQSKLTTIRPGGYLSFPVINDIRAASLTLPELKKIVNKEYSKLIDHLNVTLILKVMKSNLVYVMGEVANPNCYLMQRPTTVTQALALAGGILNTSERRTVLVITHDKENRPVGRLVNVRDIFEKGNIAYDILIKQYDIVYVPKSQIARADLWVEQHINQIVPRFIRASFGFSYRVDDKNRD